ncbi:MAG: hypothetical protein CUN55_09290 [Phototrophicales bacterium]|nr:MAG: hypothetical protein CUN55_09290 [Phototrophicales bacterium]
MSSLKRRDSQPEWALVAYANSLFEAEVIGGLLKTANIPYHIHQTGVGLAFGLPPGAMGLIMVIVPIEYEEEALLLLDDPTLDDSFLPLDEPPIDFD